MNHSIAQLSRRPPLGADAFARFARTDQAFACSSTAHLLEIETIDFTLRREIANRVKQMIENIAEGEFRKSQSFIISIHSITNSQSTDCDRTSETFNANCSDVKASF